ncbi:hypothetical protein C8Q79DRAFT_692734 [Trametes meyenii]|nr:hypothetical protein C8Q79DRAFT_692734 [Trametes meyenii]
MHEHSMYQPSMASTLPAEIYHVVFSYLERPALLSCALSCRRWALLAQYTLFRNVAVYTQDSLDSLLHTLRTSPHLRSLVQEYTIVGRRPQRGETWSWINLVLDPGDLLPSPELLPHLRAFRFEYWDSVQLSYRFRQTLRLFKRVTEVTLRCCRFSSSCDMEDIALSFPRLDTFTLDSVRWEGDGERVRVGRPERLSNPLRLKRLRICNPYEYEEVFQWLKSHNCFAVRRLELLHFDVHNMRAAAAYVKELGGVLESLTVGLALPLQCDPSTHWLDLSGNTNLRALGLQICDVSEHYVSWVCGVLVSGMHTPLARIAISFTLDYGSSLGTAMWGAIHAALTMYWHPTLREVAFTHHAVPCFLQDAEPFIRRRFWELDQLPTARVPLQRSIVLLSQSPLSLLLYLLVFTCYPLILTLLH